MPLRSSSAFTFTSFEAARPFGLARSCFFGGGGDRDREVSGLLVFRLRFLAGAVFRGGDLDTGRSSFLTGTFFRGGLRDGEREESLL